MVHDSIGHTYRAEASEETKEKLRNINLGKKLSEEHKQKISASHKGKKLTPKHCKKISEVQRGKKQSSTSIEKRIISRKKFYEENPDKIPKMSKETKEKLKKCNLGHKTNEKQRNALALGRTKKGEDVSHSILTEKEVIEIKHHLLNKSMSVINMGKLYNVSIAAIYDIKQGRTWKHVL